MKEESLLESITNIIKNEALENLNEDNVNISKLVDSFKFNTQFSMKLKDSIINSMEDAAVDLEIDIDPGHDVEESEMSFVEDAVDSAFSNLRKHKIFNNLASAIKIKLKKELEGIFYDRFFSITEPGF